MLRLLPLALLFPALAAADNIAACEVAVASAFSDPDAGQGEVIAYRDATRFIAAATDPDSEPLLELDGYPVRVLLCERSSVVPSESDRALLATGIPLALSTDFDSSDAPTAVLQQDGDGILHILKGEALSEADQFGLQAFIRPLPGP